MVQQCSLQKVWKILLFTKKFWELAILKNGHFWKTAILDFFSKKKKKICFIPMKISPNLYGRIDGSKFWYFPWFPENSLLCVILRYTVYTVTKCSSENWTVLHTLSKTFLRSKETIVHPSIIKITLEGKKWCDKLIFFHQVKGWRKNYVLYVIYQGFATKKKSAMSQQFLLEKYSVSHRLWKKDLDFFFHLEYNFFTEASYLLHF